MIEVGSIAAQSIGMQNLVVHFEHLRGALAEVPIEKSANPGGLTDREVQVLQELAAGKSNREIAEALFITQNTVIRHVANIFAKTGSANRARAAVFASEHGIRSSE